LLIDVQLRQDHALVGIFRGHLFEHRRKRLARAAPFGPEIENHQLVARWLDDFLPETVDRFLLVDAWAHARHVSVPPLRRCAALCAIVCRCAAAVRWTMWR